MGKLTGAVGQVIRAKVALARHPPDDPKVLRTRIRKLETAIASWWEFYEKALQLHPELQQTPEAQAAVRTLP